MTLGRLAPALGLTLCLALACAAPATALSDDELPAAYSSPWLALQQPDGQFRDFVSGAADGAGRYGEALLGYALLHTGIRTGDQAKVDAGLRAIGYVLRHPERQEADRSVFETYALAAAYNLARVRLPGDARVAALGAAWNVRLATERPSQLRPGRPYWNKSIVEAAAVLELLATGVRSAIAGTWLYDRRAALGRVTRLINRTIPRRAPRADGRVMLSDPPAQPPAYHALSLGFYARAVRLLGRRASRPARRALRRAAQTSLALAAPDGDLAYTGRSQEQAWALSFSAYGAEVAARATRGRKAARLRGLAARAVARLQAFHPVIDAGMAIVPAFRGGVRTWYPGIDRYAAAAPYAGLTIMGLNLAAELGVGGPAAASDRSRAVSSIAAEEGDMAVLRRGSVWLAVKRARSGRDLRYDFGLVALKRRDQAGWRDVIPHRPLAFGPSLGPTLLRAGAEREPHGRRIAASRRRIRVSGRFGESRRRVVFDYVATSSGVELRFRGRPRASYRYSTFFPARDAPAAAGRRGVAGVGQSLRVNVPVSVSITGGFSSAVEPDLVRVDLTFKAGRSGRIRILTRA